MGKIVVVQKRSTIAQSKANEKVLRSMGLGKIGKKKEYSDNNCIRGMINKIKHLVDYEIVSETKN